MVSLRCIMMVKEELKKLGLHYATVELGVVDIMENITENQYTILKKNLQKSGLELLDDKKSILIEKIKAVIIEMVHYADELPNVNYSEYISIHKIEKVKELLLYYELNLTEISYKLHYSSVAHLSNQFKKITGLSPSFYKQLKQKRNKNLENM